MLGVSTKKFCSAFRFSIFSTLYISIKKSFVSSAIYKVSLSLNLQVILSKHSKWGYRKFFAFFSKYFHFIFSMYNMAAPTFLKNSLSLSTFKFYLLFTQFFFFFLLLNSHSRAAAPDWIAL